MIEQNERRGQREHGHSNETSFIHTLLPEVNKVMLVIISAHVELGGKLLKLYYPDNSER